MGDIVKLPPRETEVVARRCECGCVSFIIRSDQLIECSSCGETYDPEDHHWKVSFIPKTLEYKFEPSHRTVVLPGELQLMRLLRDGLKSINRISVAAIVLDNGLVRMWSPTFREEAGKEWLRKNLETVYELATRDESDG